MLRTFVIALGVLCLAGGAIAVLAGAGGGWGAMALGAILILGTVYERVHYKPLAATRPGPGWERTSERFVDEQTGKTVTVYVRPETGERQYVED